MSFIVSSSGSGGGSAKFQCRIAQKRMTSIRCGGGGEGFAPTSFGAQIPNNKGGDSEISGIVKATGGDGYPKEYQDGYTYAYSHIGEGGTCSIYISPIKKIIEATPGEQGYYYGSKYVFSCSNDGGRSKVAIEEKTTVGKGADVVSDGSTWGPYNGQTYADAFKARIGGNAGLVRIRYLGTTHQLT